MIRTRPPFLPSLRQMWLPAIFCLFASWAAAEVLAQRAGEHETALELAVDGLRVNALWTPTDQGQATGTLLLLDDTGDHLDALRHYLPAHGWNTLLVQVPPAPARDAVIPAQDAAANAAEPEAEAEVSAPPSPARIPAAALDWLRERGEVVTAVAAGGSNVAIIADWMAGGAQPAALILIDTPPGVPIAIWRGSEAPLLDIVLGHDRSLRRAQDERRQRLRSRDGYRALTLPPATVADGGEAMARRVRGWLQGLEDAGNG